MVILTQMALGTTETDNRTFMIKFRQISQKRPTRFGKIDVSFKPFGVSTHTGRMYNFGCNIHDITGTYKLYFVAERYYSIYKQALPLVLYDSQRKSNTCFCEKFQLSAQSRRTEWQSDDIFWLIFGYMIICSPFECLYSYVVLLFIMKVNFGHCPAQIAFQFNKVRSSLLCIRMKR